MNHDRRVRSPRPVKLLYAMTERSAKRGIATLCLDGGEAVALLVERP